MSETVRVLIADDSFVVRGGLRSFVTSQKGFEVVGEATSGREAVENATRLKPDVVLMDLRMRDGDGISATRELTAKLPETRTLILTWSEDPAHLRDAIIAGAKGYLVHGRFTSDELATALRAIVEGGALITPVLASELISTAKERESRAKGGDPSRLTAREHEILSLVKQGKTNREIAGALGIEEKTVKNHINSIYSKLNLGSRLEAMAASPAGSERR